MNRDLHRRRRRPHRALVAALAVATLGLIGDAAVDAIGLTSDCDTTVTADSLNAAFDGSIDGFVGADYQRTHELPDGRVLWTFQDVYLEDASGRPMLVHNAALMQTGSCFEVLHGGTETEPESWIGAAATDPFERWYWLLDGYVADENTLVLFVAEMSEPGPGYLERTEPVATWSVEVDLDTMTVGPMERAPNPGNELYGFSVTTDDEYVYLYAQCHRQFGFSEVGHDPCGGDVYVGRRPLHQPASYPLEYWTGDGWSRNSTWAVNIAPETGPDGETRHINPMQVERDGDQWIAVTKVDDWWGDAVYIDTAPRPEGPWTTVAVEPVANDDQEVANYFASIVPSDDTGHMIALGYNRWDGQLSSVYRPHFVTIDDPSIGGQTAA